ncbi:MAG: flavodoxin domain-containing protein [Eubacteriales bacterium]|nr:flavodoxin domain-containing protein [Eubacteriales bacterium]
MNVKVAYFSKSGNTKKLADCIAKTAGVKAESIGNGAAMEADLLFLGASVYWAGIDGKMKNYIDQLDSRKVKKVVVFSTSALAERAYPDIKKRLEKRGIAVAAENFYCRGSFAAMHKGRPNSEDLKEAAAFTKKILG